MPTKLGDLCSVITKGTTPTSIGFDFSDSGVRFLRVQNIFDGKVNYDDGTLFIGEDVHDALKRSQIAPGDVLISIAGTIGRTGIVPDDAPELNCNQAVAILRTNEKVYQPFLRHWLESAEAQRQMRGATVTGTIQNLSLSQIGELRIPLPPLPEQRRIAAILDKADGLRTKRREALAQIDRLAQSIFVEMFGDPVASGIDDSHVPFEQVTERITYGFTSPMKHLESGIPILTAKNVKNGYLDLQNAHYAEQSEFNALTSKSKPKKGDILITKDGTIGRTAVVETD